MSKSTRQTASRVSLRWTIVITGLLVVGLGFVTPIGIAIGDALAVPQTVSASDVQPGDQITVDITLNATGYSAPAVDADPPDGWTVVDYDDCGEAGCISFKESKIQWVWGSSGIYNVQYQVKVPSDTEEGSYTISVERSGLNDDGLREVAITNNAISVSVNDRPQANAGGQYSVNEGGSVTLDDSASNDPDGSIQSTTWSLVDGPGSVSGGEYRAPDRLSSDAQATVEVTVTDDDGATDSATATVEINEVNDEPTADAGGPYSVNPGGTIQLSGSGSDEEGSVTTAWSLVDGPGSISDGVYQAPDQVSSGTTASARLTVTDNDGASATATATIEINEGNNAPTADAGENRVVDEGASVELDGTGSSDPEGDSLSYSWTQTRGPSVSLQNDETATPEFTAPEVSSSTELTFRLTVEDGNGGSSTDTVEVSVKNTDDGNQNQKPEADAGEDKQINSGESVELDATGSSDPDQDSLSFSWAQIEGPEVDLQDGNSATPEVTAPATVDGRTDVRFEVTVSDGQGGSDTDTVVVTLLPTTETLSASFTTSTSAPLEGNDVVFDASESNDPSGEIVSYEWDFDSDDRTDNTGSETTHVFDAIGTHQVTLLVTTEEGETASVTKSVQVLPAASPLSLAADVGSSPTNGTVDATLTVTNDGSADVPSATVNITSIPTKWMISGAGGDGAFNSMRTEILFLPGPAAGGSVTHDVTLAVPDGTNNGAYTMAAELSNRSGTVVDVVDVTITIGGVVTRYDEDGSGNIETNEVLGGISDWSEGNLTTQEVLTLIDEWASA